MDTLKHRLTRERRQLAARLVAVPFLLCALSCDDPHQLLKTSSIVALFVDGPAEIKPGATATFKAFLRDYSNSRVVDVTQESAWSSSNPAVVSIDRGVATGVASGVATLQARFEEHSYTKSVVITTIPGVPLRPSAILAIEQFSLTVSEPSPQGVFEYATRFRLRETGNVSGATIKNISIEGPSGGSQAGQDCWRQPLRVPPGETLDTFFTDAGWASLGYCTPDPTSGRTATPQIRLVVSFLDDEGLAGSVEAVATATNPE